MSGKASKLMKDLNNVPSIVGSLGLAIAEAQKAFNLDYLENIERLLAAIKSIGNPSVTDEEQAKLDQFKSFLQDMLVQLAPSRYQFTETTLQVRMDLAQSIDLGAEVSFGGQVGAFTVGGGLALAYGQDYRAAAEVTTIINAIPADKSIMNSLFTRADKLDAQALSLPAGATVDKDLMNKVHELAKKVSGVELPEPEENEEDG